MQIGGSDQENFQQLEYEEVNESVYQHRQQKQKPQKPKIKVEIIESERKSQEMNILQNQYYQIIVKKAETVYRNIIRRFSDIDFLFESLFSKYPGFIFPAFPGKGLLVYVKTKVTITKDTQYLRNRMKVIERFFNKILNNPIFKQQTCEEIRKFFSDEKEFDIYKKVQKSKQSAWTISNPWNTICSYLKISNSYDHKYKTFEDQINQLKKIFQTLYSKVKDMISLILAQFQCNDDFISKSPQIQGFEEFKKQIQQYQSLQQKVLNNLNELNFILFCENQDFVMVYNCLQNRQELKKNEQTYNKVRQFEQRFAQQNKLFIKEKKTKKEQLIQKFNNILTEIQNNNKRGNQ